MKALSIRQPWAWLIVHGHKDIENRAWPTKFRGRIYVHAGKAFDYDGFNYLCRNAYLLKGVNLEAFVSLALYPPLGIIGEVDIVDCVTQSDSPWFVGPYGLVLRNPVAYTEPIPMKGRLGLFEVEMPQ